MRKLSPRALSALTNLALALIVTVVGVVCFLPPVSEASTLTDGVYYEGNSPKGVSLMFNVYWGNEELRGVLDVLDEKGAKATFFLGGCWADDNVPLVKEIADRGHEIGSHGYFHRDHGKLTYAQNVEEIKTSAEFLSRVTGRAVNLFAPPSGAYSKDTVSAASSLGLKTVMWSKDTIDWRDKDAAVCFRRATEGVEAGDLVLMHPMPHTLAALPDIIDEYAERGLCLLTVGENLTAEGI